MTSQAKSKAIEGPARLLQTMRNGAHDVASTSKKRPGWHYSVLGGVSVTAFSLLCNIILLVVGVSKYNNVTGRGQLSSGSCSIVPALDTAFHLGINILSALILGASNAAMQILSAPTRAGLDKLHAQGKFADIGLNGFRNLKIMSPLRRILWAILLFSSVPLHLLYNSVVVSTVTSWDWYGFLVTSDFTLGANHPGSDWNHTATNNLTIGDDKLSDLQQRASTGQLQRMDPAQCIQTFSATPVYGYSSVLMVVNQVPYSVPPNSGSVLGLYNSVDPSFISVFQEFYNLTWAAEHGSLLTPGTPETAQTPIDPHEVLVNAAEVQSIPETWPLFWNNTPLRSVDGENETADPSRNAPPADFSIVDHCLAQPVDSFCTVDTLPLVQAVVVLINTLKLVCLLVLLFKVSEEPLITLGDAITSFLTNPDSNTADGVPMDILRVKRIRKSSLPIPRWTLSNRRYWWFRGASPLRWLSTGLFCILYLIVGLFFMSYYGGPVFTSAFNRYSSTDAESRNEVGVLGGYNNSDFGLSSTVINIIVANIFQLLLSIAYFQYNGIVTSMLLSREWTNFARYRKGLRVSSPRGLQRRTFWLSLPYAYNIPLLFLASILHWMMSESVYYEEENVLDGRQVVKETSFGAPNFNLIAKGRHGVFMDVSSLSVLNFFAAFCILAVIGLGFRRYAGGIPIVRSNSLALSRACHERFNQPEDPLAPIAWGIRARGSDGSLDVGLSSDEIELVDPSSLQFNRFERLVYRFKNHSHAKVAGVCRRLTFSRRRKAPKSLTSESMETIIEKPGTVPIENRVGLSSPDLRQVNKSSEHEWDYMSIPPPYSSGANMF